VPQEQTLHGEELRQGLLLLHPSFGPLSSPRTPGYRLQAMEDIRAEEPDRLV